MDAEQFIEIPDRHRLKRVPVGSPEAQAFLAARRQPLAGPSLGRKILNFSQAVLHHTLRGLPLVDAGKAAERIALCQACNDRGEGPAYWDAEKRRCNHPACGCNMDTKATWAEQACPIGRWPAELEREAPAPIVINQGAGGLGDAISASSAVNGLRLLHEAAGTGRRFVYRVASHAKPFIELLDLGDDVAIGVHDWDAGSPTELPPNARPRDVQLNPGYQQELSSHGEFTRVERNCRNLGGVTPVLAELRSRDHLVQLGADLAGVVALAPFSSWTNREWPIDRWRELERLLREDGYRVLVMDGNTGTRRARSRTLKSDKLIDASARWVYGAMLNAALLISNDSGLAHVAGIAGTPALVLCNMLPGQSMYGFYGEHMHFIDAQLEAISAAEVLRRAVELAGPPRPAYGETSKAHARRLQEGWFANVAPPCLDVGCNNDFLLPVPGFPCRRWDYRYGDGDAQVLAGVEPASFQTVYASHVLEHVLDPAAALRRWFEVLRPGGRLIVCVPHRDLYEGKLALPSSWNGDHKTFWLPEAPAAGDPPHTRGLRQSIAAACPGAVLESLRILDAGHYWPATPEDHPCGLRGSMHPHGEYSIEAIVRKPGDA